MFKQIFTLLITSLSIFSFAQSKLQGNFPLFAGRMAYLYAFQGFDQKVLDSTFVDAKGYFALNYKQANGTGLLVFDDMNSCLVAFTDEQILLSGIDLTELKNIQVEKGDQTRLMHQFLGDFALRSEALNGWFYMRRLYEKEQKILFNQNTINQISHEIERLKNEEMKFLSSIQNQTFLHQYLLVRKSIYSVIPVLEYRKEDLPNLINSFREINHADVHLWSSGLLADCIRAHFYLLENNGGTLQEVYDEMSKSIDLILEQLVNDNEKLNAISNHLFSFLEQRSLYQASEYLALRILDLESCSLDNEFANRLEFYRKLKIGNQAPAFIFNGDIFSQSKWVSGAFNLNDLNAEYKILVFGASWCPKCADEVLEIINHYESWKKMGAEIIFISLDTEPELFKSFARVIPGISLCDYAKWDGKVVKDFHVFSTPTIFLLDKNQNILLRPFSIYHLNAWLELNARN